MVGILGVVQGLHGSAPVALVLAEAHREGEDAWQGRGVGGR